MKRPRCSILDLMRLAIVVALNMEIAQWLFRGEPWRLAGGCLTVVAIQVALLLMIRARGRPRHYAFWAGFELGILLGLCSFLRVRVPESWVGDCWDVYATWIDGLLTSHFGLSALKRPQLDPVFLTIVAVFAFIPQAPMGLCCGLLALSLAWSSHCRAITIKLLASSATLIVNLAAWFAVWYAIPAQPPGGIIGVSSGGLVMNWGFVRLIQSWRRPQSRAFWCGFVTLGSVVLASYLRGVAFAGIPLARYFTNWPKGPWYARPVTDLPLWTLWTDYTAVASYGLGIPAQGIPIVAWTGRVADTLAYALIILVPHMLFALGGGAACSRIIGRKRPDNPAPAPSPESTTP